MSRDIHKAPFDEGTKAKLAIFQDYFKEWLPVFLSKEDIYWKTINIFDFFAGPGSDSEGNKGTPLIIIDEISRHFDNIISKNIEVNLYFNEYNKKKKCELQSKLMPEHEDLRPYSVDIESLDFREAFEKQYPKMKIKNCVNLLFLDQNGIKHISEDIFSKIISLKRTDFLFFISSSTIKRFSDHPNIYQYIKTDARAIEKIPYHKIHRHILNYYKSLIPIDNQYHLASFSLKKNSGIYGLIFGSSHVLGIEKFLTTCWNIDPERGEANFDIDEDNIVPNQIEFFTGKVRQPKKVEQFEKELQEKILSEELRTDKDIYLFILSTGFTPKHARQVVKQLILDKKINKCKLNLSNRICKRDSIITEIKLTNKWHNQV